MSRAVTKEFVRTIRHSFGRFMAIAIISFLGAGVFAGLRMAAPDIRDSADEFFDATNMYDAMVVSTLGFDEKSLASIESVKGVEAVMPGYSIDALVGHNGESLVASVQSLSDSAAQSDTSDDAHAYSDDENYLNRPVLIEGMWPLQPNECLIGEQQAEELGIAIGDVLKINRVQGDQTDVFSVKSFKVIGYALSSAFCSDVQLDTSKLGNGVVDLYLYVPFGAFDDKLPYTTIYLTIEGARDAKWGSESYNNIVDPVMERIRAISPDITDDRNNSIRNKAQGELGDARNKFLEEKTDAEKELDDARTELEDTHGVLKDTETKLNEARKQLVEARQTLVDTKAQLDQAETEYTQNSEKLKATREQQGGSLSNLPQLRAQRDQLKENPNTPASELAAINAQIQQLEQLQAELTTGEAALAQSRTKLDASWKQYRDGLAEYEKNLADYEKSVSTYEEGRESYTTGLDEFKEKEQEAKDGFEDAERELNKAQADIDELESTEVFVASREKNVGAAAREHDALSIQQIATYLPFVFILVAVLVVLTSMTRMVDEERIVIGTHKALGYGKGRIRRRYLAYGFLASGIGSVLGVFCLGKLLPWFVLSSYAINYSIPFMPLTIYPLIAAEAIGITVGAALLTTWVAVTATLHEKPAALLLPRVPKAGKRILLERISIIWRHLSFSRKVTARNLFRYKPRFFMAVVGVAGCTALLMIGFGMRDVIDDIVTSQYEELVTYDALVKMSNTTATSTTTSAESTDSSEGTNSNLTSSSSGTGSAQNGSSSSTSNSSSTSSSDQLSSERAALKQSLSAKRTTRAFGQKGVESYLYVSDENMIASADNKDLRLEVIVPSDATQLSDFITLRNRITGESISLKDDSVVVSEKAASELGLKVGDSITLYEENLVADKMGRGYSFKIGAITENYLQHYVYMTSKLYKKVFGKTPDYSTVLVTFEADANQRDLADNLISQSAVSSVSLMSDRIKQYVEMLDIMTKLIVVILGLAGALAFVVLYNLTNININERVREIATLKVLGFTQRETSSYIFREVFLMVIIGALVGCAIGLPLTLNIVEAAETANIMFGRTIAPVSFALSFAITLVFAIIITFFMKGKLSRVNMVESLKSVE